MGARCKRPTPRRQRLKAQKELERQTALMSERRQRGIPDDIYQLAKAGQRDKAVAEYARRYELSLAQARNLIDAYVK